MVINRIIELSSIISRDTALVEDYCQRHGVASPSFDLDAPPTVMVPPSEPEVAAAKDRIVMATRELGQLMQGPVPARTNIGFIDAFTCHAISRFRIGELVPVGQNIKYEELSKACGLNVTNLRRILRFAMTHGWFCEPREGYVAHTSFSRLLAENEMFRRGTAFTFEECFQAAARATDALQQHPDSEEPILSGWGVANSASKPMFEELHERYPTRHLNAATAMNQWNSFIPASPLVDNFPWDTVDTVVDIGGGHGPVSLSIAKQQLRPTFVVQDLSSVVSDGPGKIPTEFKDRIAFMAHDMFEEQPVRDADVYLFRSIFHDWPDKYCVQVLQALIPALKPGARIVINDACMPPPGILPSGPDRTKRMWDLNMMVLFNSRDRQEAEWAQLFEKADKRFKFQGVRVPDVNVKGISPSFLLHIIEAIWEP